MSTLRAMVRSCIDAYPHEACGLLGGIRQEVRLVVPVHNVDTTDPGSRFLMDPEQQLGAWRKIQVMGYDVIGVYHSHPVTAETSPSRYDLEMTPPGMMSVIVGIKPTAPLTPEDHQQTTPPERLLWHPMWDLRYRTWDGETPLDLDPFVMWQAHAQ